MWRRRRAQQAANVCFPSSNPHAAASDMHPPQDARLFTACNKNPSLPGCPYTPPVCACVLRCGAPCRYFLDLVPRAVAG